MGLLLMLVPWVWVLNPSYTLQSSGADTVRTWTHLPPGDICVSCFQSDLNSREQETCQPVHVVNVDIQDNHEEATLGAFLICELCQCVSLSTWVYVVLAKEVAANDSCWGCLISSSFSQPGQILNLK